MGQFFRPPSLVGSLRSLQTNQFLKQFHSLLFVFWWTKSSHSRSRPRKRLDEKRKQERIDHNERRNNVNSTRAKFKVSERKMFRTWYLFRLLSYSRACRYLSPVDKSIFVNIYLFHVLKFFDYRIPRLPFEIVACTLPFLQNETNRPIGEHSLL